MNARAVGGAGCIGSLGRERVPARGDESELFCLISVGNRS